MGFRLGIQRFAFVLRISEPYGKFGNDTGVVRAGFSEPHVVLGYRRAGDVEGTFEK